MEGTSDSTKQLAPVETTGFDLHPFQREAVERWLEGDSRGPRRGTLEIATGAGKNLIALVCFARASETHPGLRLAVVVPTEALAHQWIEQLQQRTSLEPSEIGL